MRREKTIKYLTTTRLADILTIITVDNNIPYDL